MAKVIFGNHSSVLVPQQDRDSIRKFYCDVLGGKIMKADFERDFIRDFIDSFICWASTQLDIQAVALVGSYARNMATESSDIDLVLLTTRPNRYLENAEWLETFGIRSRRWVPKLIRHMRL
jgi:UTP:GlnB (protein PII) uridylyltransferase